MYSLIVITLIATIFGKFLGADGLSCQKLIRNSGNITDLTAVPYDSTHQLCWLIPVPSDKLVRLYFRQLNLNKRECDDVFLKVSINGNNEEYKFCASDFNPKPITSLNDVNITYYVHSNVRDVYGFLLKYSGNIDITYNIEDILCAQKNSFRCSNHICIPKEKVCDGVKDCDNAADEIGCETGVFSVEGVDEIREQTISWLKNQRNSAFDWGKNTPRATVALRLSDGANYDGSKLDEELVAKQVELETAVDLLRNWSNPLLPNELSTLINALVATCHDPRRFHGLDLLQILKNQVTDSAKSVNPIAFLAICNANESSPVSFNEKIRKILKENSDKPDVQAVAIIALSCMMNRKSDFEDPGKVTVQQYKETIKKFKSLQMKDGTFGNVYTTALVTQALLSSGEGKSKDWKLNSTIRYLMRHLNSSSVDFLSAYLALPIFNGKTLADLSTVNCLGYTRHKGDGNLLAEVEEDMGAKIQIHYSLYVGDKMQIVHTVRMKVPGYISAFDVMKIAAKNNPKFKFQSRRISDKIYIYEIAGLTNDPERGKFWMLHLVPKDNDSTGSVITESADEVSLNDGDHLIMWYDSITV